MSDITEISGWLNNEAFLVTMDIEKAFDSLDHDFASSVLRKFWIWQKFYHMDKNFIKRSTLLCYKWWKNYPIF